MNRRGWGVHSESLVQATGQMRQLSLSTRTRTYCRLQGETEPVRHKPRRQAALAHIGVTNEEQLEGRDKVVARP